MEEQRLTRSALREKILAWIPEGPESEDVVSGVVLAVIDPELRTRPMERDLLKPDTLYAWRSEDVPIVEPALRLLGELVAGGFVSPTFIGVGVVELVTVLIKLRRHRAAVRAPGEVAVLLCLRDGPPGGMSASGIAERLAREAKPALSGRAEVVRVLDELATPRQGTRPHALVERDGNLWKALV
jgi:hypothetical protein